MSLKVGFIIIARMKSTRLPKKLTLKIVGKTIISLMIERLKESKLLDEVILATSTNQEDGILCDIADQEKIKCFRGSENDVLKRIYDAAKEYNLDYILHVTGDSPFVSYDFFEDVIETYKETNADLITNFDLPHGFFFYGIKVDAIKKVLEMKATDDTEIWGDYFMKTNKFKVIKLEIPEKYKRKYRLTVDYIEDYEFLKKLFEKSGEDIHKKPTSKIIEFLDKNPDIVKINEDCEEKYKKRFDSQKKMELKQEYNEDVGKLGV